MLRAATLALALSIVLAASLLGSQPRIAAQEATPASCPPGTEEENLAVVQRYCDLVNAHQSEDLLDVYAPVVIQHAADVPDARGAEEAVANLALFLDAFPDLHSEVDQMHVDDDLVAVRVIQ